MPQFLFGDVLTKLLIIPVTDALNALKKVIIVLIDQSSIKIFIESLVEFHNFRLHLILVSYDLSITIFHFIKPVRISPVKESHKVPC